MNPRAHPLNKIVQGQNMLTDIAETNEYFEFEGQNLTRRQKMQKFLGKIIRRITLITMSSRAFKIKVSMKPVDLSQFAVNYKKVQNVGDIINETQDNATRKAGEYVTELVPFVNYSLFFEQEMMKNLQLQAIRIRDEMNNKTAELKEIEQSIRKLNFQRLLANRDILNAVQNLQTGIYK